MANEIPTLTLEERAKLAESGLGQDEINVIEGFLGRGPFIANRVKAFLRPVVLETYVTIRDCYPEPPRLLEKILTRKLFDGAISEPDPFVEGARDAVPYLQRNTKLIAQTSP